MLIVLYIKCYIGCRLGNYLWVCLIVVTFCDFKILVALCFRL